MGVFTRCLNADVIDKLKGEKLFAEKLLPDIRSGTVFPAIRHNYIDFYHRGGRLFHYDKNGFSTHYKYLTRIRIESPYVSAIMPKDYIVDDFLSGYESIQYACALYSGSEANLVSALYGQSLHCTNPTKATGLRLLDIECSFESMDQEPSGELEYEAENREKTTGTASKQGRSDRIDLVFLNRDSGELLFCEAKQYADKRIWSKSKEPEVVGQLRKYNRQLQGKAADIKDAYRSYLEAMNLLFGTSCPAGGLAIIPDVVLLVTGFDDSQNKMGVPALKQKLAGVPVKFVGAPNGNTPGELYRIAAQWSKEHP